MGWAPGCCSRSLLSPVFQLQEQGCMRVGANCTEHCRTPVTQSPFYRPGWQGLGNNHTHREEENQASPGDFGGCKDPSLFLGASQAFPSLPCDSEQHLVTKLEPLPRLSLRKSLQRFPPESQHLGDHTLQMV